MLSKGKERGLESAGSCQLLTLKGQDSKLLEPEGGYTERVPWEWLWPLGHLPSDLLLPCRPLGRIQ